MKLKSKVLFGHVLGSESVSLALIGSSDMTGFEWCASIEAQGMSCMGCVQHEGQALVAAGTQELRLACFGIPSSPAPGLQLSAFSID